MNVLVGKVVTYCSSSMSEVYLVFALILLKIESNRFMWNTRILGNLTIKCLFLALVVVFLQLSHVYLSVISLSVKWSLKHCSRLFLWFRLWVMNGAYVIDSYLHFPHLTIVCSIPIHIFISLTLYITSEAYLRRCGLLWMDVIVNIQCISALYSFSGLFLPKHFQL